MRTCARFVPWALVSLLASAGPVAVAGPDAVTRFSAPDQGLALALTYAPSVPLSRLRHQNFGVLIRNTTAHRLSLFLGYALMLELSDAAGRPASAWGANVKQARLSAREIVTIRPGGTLLETLQFGMTPLFRLRPGRYVLHAALLDMPGQWPREVVHRAKSGVLPMWLGSRVQSPDAAVQIIRDTPNGYGGESQSKRGGQGYRKG